MRPPGLRRQLIVALVVPATVVLVAMAYFADVAVRRTLDDALGARLVGIAQSAAQLIDPRIVLLDPGQDDARLARATAKRLDKLIAATGVERVLVVGLEGSATFADSAGRAKIGDPYFRASIDIDELDAVKGGHGAASVLFEDDAGRWYKSAYAPLFGKGDAPPKAAVVVHAPAEFFDAIGDMRATLGAISAAGLLALVLLASAAARGVTVPLSQLADVAGRIGRGELDAEVPADGPEEAQVLAGTMRSMAASLSARDEEMQVMLAGIAHEVRNPLGGIELFGSLLEEELEGDEEKQSYAQKIRKEIAVLSGVVNDFLAFARKHPLDARKVSIAELIDEVAAMASPLAEDKSIDLRHEVDRKLHAQIDPEAINRALLNLVRNAIQATPDGGSVVLRAEIADDALRLIVEDSGPGIPADKHAEVFAPFFTTKQKGTGLGLALVKKSVDTHRGTIRVEDATAGGARFVMELPVTASLEAMTPDEEPGLLD